jgi:hypothetical protein
MLVFVFISVLIVGFSILGERIIRRRFRRTLELIAHVAKIEYLLGLFEPLPEEVSKAGLFHKDKYIFQRYMKTRLGGDSDDPGVYEDETDWIDRRIEIGPTTYTDLRWLFRAFMIIGLLLAITDVLLAVGFSVGIM